MFSSAKIQKILHLTQYLSSFYYLCTNYFRNETKNSITLHHVATFDVSITRSGSQRRRGGQHKRRRKSVLFSCRMPSLQMAMASTTSISPRMVTGTLRSSTPIYIIGGDRRNSMNGPTMPPDGMAPTAENRWRKEGVYFCLVKAKGADGVVYNIKRDVNLLRGYTEEQNSNY